MDENGFVWLTVEWLQLNFKQVGLTVLYSLCLMTAFAFLSKKVSQRRKQAERDRTATENDSITIRKLSRFESALDHHHKFGGSITSYALIIKSKVYIHPNLVKNTLIYLTKKNEILRTKISRKKIRIQGKKKVEKEWVEMDNPDFAEFHLKLKAMTSDQWQTVFERELTKQFPEEGPLWRFVMLKEQFDPEEGMYSQSFVLSTHYLVCDCYSGFSFFKDFLESISQQLEGVKLEQEVLYPVRPSLPDLLKSHIDMSQPAILYTIGKRFIERMVDRVKPKPIYKNPFTLLYPPTIATNPLMPKRTYLIPRSLSKDDTKKLIKLCKANQCTVHGAFAAIATISMATLMQNGEENLPIVVQSSFSVDLRKDGIPVVGPSELGCYSVDCNIAIPCACTSLKTCDPHFWEFAQSCDIALQNALQNGDHLKELRLLETLRTNNAKYYGNLAKDANAAGRIASLFRISNLGKKNVLDSSPDFRADGFYFAVAEHNIGPVFSNNITTVNGSLYWGFVYFSNVMTAAQALEYVNLVMDNLKEQ